MPTDIVHGADRMLTDIGHGADRMPTDIGHGLASTETRKIVARNADGWGHKFCIHC